jgi:hypothetical protein
MCEVKFQRVNCTAAGKSGSARARYRVWQGREKVRERGQTSCQREKWQFRSEGVEYGSYDKRFPLRGKKQKRSAIRWFCEKGKHGEGEAGKGFLKDMSAGTRWFSYLRN